MDRLLIGELRTNMKIINTFQTKYQIYNLVQDNFTTLGQPDEYAILTISKTGGRDGGVLTSQYFLKTWKTLKGAQKAFEKEKASQVHPIIA